MDGLIRIVRMTFQEDKLDDFTVIFQASKDKIRAFPGCRHLELLKDLDKPTVRMTYSLWESPEALEQYRQSELFQTTWAATKKLFSDKPVAFSAGVLEQL